MSGSKNIDRAADHLNNTLISKGFIKEEERLLFASISTDLNELLSSNLQNNLPNNEQEKDILNSEITYKNDKVIINLIYQLVQALEKSKKQKDLLISKIEEKQNNEIQLKQERIRMIERNQILENKVNSYENQKQVYLTKVKEYELNQKGLKEEVVKVKSFNDSVRAKVQNELRKRDTKNKRLKDRLQDARKSKMISGIQLQQENGLSREEVEAALGQDNTNSEIIQLGAEELFGSTNTLLLNLALEKQELVQMLKNMQQYIRDAAQSTQQQTQLPQPADYLEPVGEEARVGEEAPDRPDLVQVLVASEDLETVRAETAESLVFFREFVAHVGAMAPADYGERLAEIAALKQSLATTTANWKTAIETMETWREYRVTRE